MPSELTYLRVHNFRRVRPGTFIAFEPQLNTVVGRNGTGKTKLLALISAIVRNNFHQFIREPFEIGFGLVDGDLSFEGVCKNELDSRSSPSRRPVRRAISTTSFHESGTASSKSRDSSVDKKSVRCGFLGVGMWGARSMRSQRLATLSMRLRTMR